MHHYINYFFDTEFIEVPGQLIPISIGMVCEDGRELHLVSNAHNWHDYPHLDPWVRKNVIAKLPPPSTWEDPAMIATKIKSFVNSPIKLAEDVLHPRFWAYFASYDWVCLCWFMQGRMIDLPVGWPHLAMDFKQSMIERGLKEDFLPEKNKKKQHDALEDARWLKSAYDRVFMQKH
jgi:hypothetical protein